MAKLNLFSCVCLIVGAVVGSIPHLLLNGPTQSWVIVMIMGSLIGMGVWVILGKVSWHKFAGATYHMVRLPTPTAPPKDPRG